MNTYRYHIESKTPSSVPYRKYDRYIAGGKVKGESLAEAQANILSKRKDINEEIIVLNLVKMDRPSLQKGRIVFSFDYCFTARDEREAEEVINKMFDYWYDSQNDELYDALVGDIGVDVATDIGLKITNATVEVGDLE